MERLNLEERLRESLRDSFWSSGGDIRFTQLGALLDEVIAIIDRLAAEDYSGRE